VHIASANASESAVVLAVLREFMAATAHLEHPLADTGDVELVCEPVPAEET
jgi:hypothetical protein